MPTVKFLDVEHKVRTKEEEPFFLGGELNVSVILKNLKEERIERRFYYFMEFPGGRVPRPLSLGIEAGCEYEYKLGPPFFFGFLGNFRISLLVGKEGRDYNEGKDVSVKSFATLFSGNVKDKYVYMIHEKTANTLKKISMDLEEIKVRQRMIIDLLHK